MPTIDTVFFGLLVAALVCSIIELGLSAYAASATSGSYTYPGYDGYGVHVPGYTYRVKTPNEVSFLVFCSVWSTLVTALLLLVPFVLRSMSKPLLGFGTLVLNCITMIFWLAGFAALATLYYGYAPGGYPGALLAFAVISWLIFLALTVLNFLTAFGVLRSERHGHHALFGKSSTGNNMTTTQHGPSVTEARV